MNLKIFAVNQANRQWHVWVTNHVVDVSLRPDGYSESSIYSNSDRYLVLIHRGVPTRSEDGMRDNRITKWNDLAIPNVWWLFYSGNGYSTISDNAQVHFLRYPIFDDKDIDKEDLARFQLLFRALETEVTPDARLWDVLYPTRITEAAVLLAILSAPACPDRDQALEKFLRRPKDLKFAYEQVSANSKGQGVTFSDWTKAISEQRYQILSDQLRHVLGSVLD